MRGRAVLPENLVAVERLLNWKARTRGKELHIMVANVEQLDSLGVIASPNLKKLLNSPLVPGGLTLVANLNSKICPKWLQGRKEIAFRIPKIELLTDIYLIYTSDAADDAKRVEHGCGSVDQARQEEETDRRRRKREERRES